MTADKQTHIFLSYARADDDPDYDNPRKSLVRRMYEQLGKTFTVWWDRETLPSRGEDFTPEIERAIRASDRFVLIVGPGAVASKYVRKEWELALSLCLPITIVLRAGDYPIIPAELGGVHAIDFRPTRKEKDALDDLINRLHEDAPLGPAVGVKPLPKAGFVLRKKPFEDAKTVLLADEINPAVVSTPSATAVYGLGGIGKSTLAAALALDCKIRRHFKDGVLWVEVGQTPTITALQQTIGVFFGDARENYQQEDTAKFALSAAVQGKQALIILDDVWDHKLVERFPITGTACRLLITTRSGQLARLVEGADIRLNVLTPEEGAQLIAGRAGGDPTDARYQAITRKLGGHTLAVALAAAQLANGHADDADDLLRLLDKRMRGEEPFKDLVLKEEDKDQNLALSLSLSYEALTPDLQRRFRALGIFPVESTFNRALLAAIWGDEDADDARTPLKTLEGAGLIEPAADETVSATGDSDSEAPPPSKIAYYQQHGLLRAYACALLMKHGELESTFGRYADVVTVQADQFYELPLEEWTQLDPLLPHVHEVGDKLVRRWKAADAESPDDTLLARCGEFAWAVTRYVNNRPQVVQVDGRNELHGMAWLYIGLKTYQKRDEKDREAPMLNNIGRAWAILGERERALECFEKALFLFQTIGDQSGQAATLHNIGGVWNALDESHKALEFYYSALYLYTIINDPRGKAITLTSIGSAWSSFKQWQQALDYYNEAMPLHKEVGTRGDEARTLNNIAYVYFNNKEFTKVEDALRQAIEIAHEIGIAGQEALFRANLADMLQATGQTSKAIQELEMAIDILKRYDLPYDAGGGNVKEYKELLTKWWENAPKP